VSDPCASAWSRPLPWGRRPIVVTGLGYGDEGKGATVDALVRRHALELVVRHNGGPQAAHHVVAPDGAVHCFAQFGAGTLVPGVRTHLSRFMLVEPLALAREAAALARIGVAAPLARLSADRECAVVTPFHRLFGRIQELSRGTARHGSCGLGVGPAWLDAHNPRLPSLRLAALCGPLEPLRGRLRLIQLVKLDQAEQLEPGPGTAELLAELARPDLVDAFIAAARPIVTSINLDSGDLLRSVLRDRPGRVIFEGAQGLLLDADHGFWPYVTPSRTGPGQAEQLLAEAGAPPPLRLGVLRAYATRHGPGPFVSECAELTARLPERHNAAGPWQGPMRVGHFDLVAARHALALCGPNHDAIDAVVFTCFDRLAELGALSVCTGYRAPDDVVHQRLEASPSDLVAHRERSAELLKTRPELLLRPKIADSGPSPPAASHARWLADALERPLAGLAFGPSAADRVWSPSASR